MVDAITEKRNERYRNRSWCEMMKSIKLSSDQISEIVEIVLYHKVKSIFLNLMDIEKEDPACSRDCVIC
jgi:hypothetical protein